MRKPLVRSPRATIAIDPVLEDCDSQIDAAKSFLSAELLGDATVDPEKARKRRVEIEESLAALEAERAEYLANIAGGKIRAPVITLRVVPPEPMSKIRLAMVRDGVDLESAAGIERMIKSNRDLARWAVVGWALEFDGEPAPFESEPIEVDGRRYSVATRDAVDVLELAGFLPSVAMAAWRFNVLSEGDRKK